MTKAKPRRRRQPKKTRWLTLENIGLIKQFFVTVGPIVVLAYGWAIPQIEAKAAEYVRSQFIAVGMDPQNIQTLNKNIAELQSKMKEKDDAVDNLSGELTDMKVDIGKVLILLQTQPQPKPPSEPIK
jgi:uncharacterized coiled-coil protein SlyX